MAGQRGVQGAVGGTDGHLPQGVRPHASPDRCHTPRGAGDTQAPVTPTPRTPRRVLAGVTGAAGCGSTPAVTRALHSLTHFPQALAHRWSTRCRAVGAGTRPTPCPLGVCHPRAAPRQLSLSGCNSLGAHVPRLPCPLQLSPGVRRGVCLYVCRLSPRGCPHAPSPVVLWLSPRGLCPGGGVPGLSPHGPIRVSSTGVSWGCPCVLPLLRSVPVQGPGCPLW